MIGLVLHDATIYEMVEIILLFELSWKFEKNILFHFAGVASFESGKSACKTLKMLLML